MTNKDKLQELLNRLELKSDIVTVVSVLRGLLFVLLGMKTASANDGRPAIVCLCGSTRFYDAFQQRNYEETMAGRIVLSVGHYPNGDGSHGEAIGCTPEAKLALDELHKRKIDLASRVIVLNVGGYIGESTKSEIAYAIAHHKALRFLEPEPGEKFMEDHSHELGAMVARFGREAVS